MTGPDANSRWEPTVGQCLTCGGRGGWWTGPEVRTTCPRCHGDGWDPARHTDWFQATIAPLQKPGGSR